MSGFLDSTLFSAVVDTAIRGTFILLAALAGTALMRRTSAAARHLVWLAALTALLLLPIARGFVPEWRVLPSVPVVFSAPAAEPVTSPAVSLDVAAIVGDAGAVAARPSNAATEAPAPFRMPMDWKTLALLAWAAGVAVLTLRLVYGLARVAWIERRATELTDDGWVRLTDGLARRLGLGRIVRLLREPGATVPMTWGIFRPVILLPREADGWDDERRRVVLAHELAHVRRWDALTQWIAHLALAVYWFNPLVWVAVRKLREEREHACDDAVLEIGTRPAEYADHLLNIVRSLGSSHGTATAALAMARRSQFEGRLLAILDNAVRRNGVSRAAGLATAAAALACLVPLAAMRPADRAALAPASVAATESPDGPTRQETTTKTTAETTVRIAGKMDERLRGEAPLADALAGLAAKRDTLSAEQAALSARLAGLDARASTLRDAAGSAPTRRELMEAAAAGDPGLYAEIIRAALDIEDSSERRLVLARVLEQGDVSPENLVAIFAATRTMGSDSERRIVITHVLEHRQYPRTAALPAVLAESLHGFTSATEQRIVLTSILERRRLDTPSLVSLFRVVAGMDSDTERRLVLVAAAERQPVEGAAREAYLAAARTIESDSEQALALSALVARPSAGPGRPPPAPAAARAPVPPAARAPVPPAARPVREARRGDQVWNSSNEYIADHDGRRRVVRIRSHNVIVGENPWDVRGLRTGGTLFVEEQMDGQRRRVEASCDGAGDPVWRYAVDGQVRPFDTAARRWMESVIRNPS
ncbi:MAG TPA: M56 family metallopeptidase [Longimicrobium sp.]|nr:M56 family metallopeptidase [Longimicrobium sp.]